MKKIIYQLLPRLFGNPTTRCVKDGTLAQNGSGKMAHITLKALHQIKALGVTHVWYTGPLQHASQTDYTSYGIAHDHCAMVKGKAGSPYAIKDYYDIDPDIAVNPAKRMQEFRALVLRTHRAGLKVIMDFVPNHVARQYHSSHCPQGVRDLGAGDRTDVDFSPDNNFYYLPGQQLTCQFDMQAGESVPYIECPAKATGNDCFSAFPSRNDWYETVKLNYGVDYQHGHVCHFAPVPSIWHQMTDILLYWCAQGIDAFRCDMAAMVPVEFWQWATERVKKQYPQVQFIGEVYNPSLYRSYIHQGGFDLLYDKVGLYDTLRAVTQGQQSAAAITHCWQGVSDIQEHMLNFLENHDEQRLASDYFAGAGERGRAALIVSSCFNTNPFMLYFGQELGERGMDEEGFSGRDGRTTIFDYWSPETLRLWYDEGHFSFRHLTERSRQLRAYYERVLSFAANSEAISRGRNFDLMYVNYDNPGFDAQHCFAFIRRAKGEIVLVVVNFSAEDKHQRVRIPQHAFDYLNLPQGDMEATSVLDGGTIVVHLASDDCFDVIVPAYSGVILQVHG